MSRTTADDDPHSGLAAVRSGPMALSPYAKARQCGMQGCVGMLSSIIVAVDSEQPDKRALRVAEWLGRPVGMPLELVTVVAPESSLGHADRERWAQANGVDARSVVVVREDDPARAISSLVNNRQGALLVMATAARSALGLPGAGRVSEAVLALLRQPVLLIGPNVEEPWHVAPPTLIACVDGSERDEVVLPVVATWAQTFGQRHPWVIEVIPRLGTAIPTDDGVETAHVCSFAERMAAAGIESSQRVVRNNDPVAAIGEFAETLPASVLVIASEPWPGSSHWFSTARKLVRSSTRPVLLVPADAQTSRGIR